MTMTEAWQAPRHAARQRRGPRQRSRRVVRDYYEGWYTRLIADRMARALHPALAKRSFGQGSGSSAATLDDLDGRRDGRRDQGWAGP